MSGFEDKVAIVTGGASGIGEATAAKLLSEGANVLVADVNEPARTGETLRFFRTDLTDGSAIEAMVEATIAQWGQLDILVNNAGVGALGDSVMTGPDEWERVFAVNSTAVYRCCHAAIPHMQKRGGAIVNTASISGLGGDYAMAAYNASKGAVINYTRSLAVDCAQYGIRANAVCPGLIETPLIGVAIDDPVDRDHWFERIPMGRAGQPEEIANVIAFLASDEASYVTGAILAADGGVMAHTGQPNFPVRHKLRAERAG